MALLIRVLFLIASTGLLVGCGDSGNSGGDNDGTLSVGEEGASGTELTQTNSDACSEVCTKMAECDAPDYGECETDCTLMAVSLRQSVFDGMTSCAAAQSCDALDPESCLEEAASSVPDNAVDGLVDTICAKMVSCVPDTTVEECREEIVGQDSLAEFKVQNDDVLDCAGECLTLESCASLGTNGEGLTATCFVGCGAMIDGADDGGGGDGDCSDLSGAWVAESVSCSGTDIPLDGMEIIQTIDDECRMEMTVENGGCTISYHGTYHGLNSGSGSLVVQHECGECGADRCAPSENLTNEFNISRSMDGSDLIFSYSVAEAVMDANMSPCPDGSFQTSVYARQ